MCHDNLHNYSGVSHALCASCMHVTTTPPHLTLKCELCNAFVKCHAFIHVHTHAGENSYSHHSDHELGVSVIDRFTYFTQRFFESMSLTSTATLQDWYQMLNWDRIHSTIVTKCAHGSTAACSLSCSAHHHCDRVSISLLSVEAQF